MSKIWSFIQVGLGGFGKTWCTGVIPETASFARPVAAVDINPETFENAVRYAGVPRERCYTDLRRALAENRADFITIVTPPAFHEQAIELALEFSCDIVCEKPVGESIDSCCRIYQKVKAAGRKMIVTMSHRMSQDKQSLEKLLRSGKYGDLNYLVARLCMTRRRTRIERLTPGHNEGACGILSEAAIHQLDILRAMSDSNAKTVYARCWRPSWHPGESGFHDSCFVDVEMENGVQAHCEQSFVNAAVLNEWGQDYIRAECDKATVLLDKRQLEARCDLGFPHPKVERLPMLESAKGWSHQLLLRQFADWLEGGEEPCCSIEDNIQCAALVYAAVHSAKTGEPVDVQAFLKSHLQAANS